jgi:uncharacterized protein (DUF1778 family)
MDGNASKLVRHLEIKLSDSEKELISNAASLLRQSRAEFVREAAKRAASDTVKRGRS